MLTVVADHLWQSTLVLAAASVLVLWCGRASPHVRYLVWTAASVKFLVPFAALAAVGAALPWPAVEDRGAAAVVTAVSFVSQPFSVAAEPTGLANPPADGPTHGLTTSILVLWAMGGFLLGLSRGRRWWRTRVMTCGARPIRAGRTHALFETRIPAGERRRLDLRSTTERTSPCVVGIVRPALLWPDGIEAHLNDMQIAGVLAHEAAHVRRHHNLGAVLHGLVEMAFWFHPGVWWLGRRLRTERELVCDRDVLVAGIDRGEYARSLVVVGAFAVGSPEAGAARMTGEVLIHRLEAVMTADVAGRMGGWRQVAVAIAGAAVLVGPVVLGAASAAPEPRQIQTSTGTVSGRVVDETGGSIAGATVSLLSMQTGEVLRSMPSAVDGRYALAGVSPDAYAIRVDQPGFRRFTTRVDVEPGSTTVADVRLQLGTLSEAVTLRILPEHEARPGPAAPSAASRELAAGVEQQAPGALALFERAEALYRQEQYAESDAALAQAVALVTAHASPTAGAAERRAEPGGQIAPPIKVRNVAPIYPAAARAIGASGTVILEARVGVDGTVQDTRVVRSIPALDAAAVRAVRQWLFTPARLNDVPTAVGMMVTVAFEAPRE